jgi:hypothetical protein
MREKTSQTLPMNEALENAGYSTVEEMVAAVVGSDENCPTRCEHGCEVEPDGICPHGHKSMLLLLGMI